MRIPLRHLGLPVLSLIVVACAEAPWPQPVHEDAAREIGAAAADRLAGTLVQHLTAALDSAGPEGAIAFCSAEATALTADVAASLAGVDVKRTSTQVRNPANAPDSLEAVALAWFESRLASGGSLPAEWVQPEGTVAMRYYRPLVVKALCVQCHGPLEALSEPVLGVLAERYPDDQATGYLPGDFRGLIRVRIAREALEAGPD